MNSVEKAEGAKEAAESNEATAKKLMNNKNAIIHKADEKKMENGVEAKVEERKAGKDAYRGVQKYSRNAVKHNSIDEKQPKYYQPYNIKELHDE